MMKSIILMLHMLCLCFLFLFWSIEVLAQTKEPKGFDLNKTPPPEDGSEDEVMRSHHPIENTDTEALISLPNEAKVNQNGKKRKLKPEIDPIERAERKRAYAREKSREWRKGVQERKLAGTPTESDLKSAEAMKARKRKYNRNHKESLAQYFRKYQRNHLTECAARSRKWRSENLVRARQADKRYRDNNVEQIKASKLRYKLKKNQESVKPDTSAQKNS